MASDTLKSKMRTGAYFWWLGNSASRVSRVAVYVVLAWILDPRDFGLVAMTTAILMVLQILSEFGIGIAIIQRKDMPHAYAATAFWLNFAASIAMTAIAWVGAPWLAEFYGEPAVTLLVRVSAIGFVITAFRTIPMAMLRKELRFGVYAGLDAGFRIGTNVAAIGFALAGARYWSLVIPNLVVGALIIPFWFLFAKWYPSFEFDRSLFREVLRYGKNVVVIALVTFVLSNAGFIFVGYFHGSDQAGLFKFAMENAMFVLYNLAWSIASVSISGFAAETDPNRLRSLFVRVYDVQLALCLPMLAVLFVLAPVIFGGIFPDKWIPVIPVFRVLLICALIRAITGHVSQYYYAVNKSHINVWFTSLMFATLMPAMYFSCMHYGLIGLAAATTVVTAAIALPMLGATARLNGWASLGLIRRSIPCIAATAIACAAAYGTMVLVQQSAVPNAVNFFLASSVGGAVYLAALYVVGREFLNRMIHDIVPERLRARYLGFLCA